MLFFLLRPIHPDCFPVIDSSVYVGWRRFPQQETTAYIILIGNREREALVDTEQRPLACRMSIDELVSLQKYCAEKLKGSRKAPWQRAAHPQTLEWESVMPPVTVHTKNIFGTDFKGG